MTSHYLCNMVWFHFILFIFIEIVTAAAADDTAVAIQSVGYSPCLNLSLLGYL